MINRQIFLFIGIVCFLAACTGNTVSDSANSNSANPDKKSPSTAKIFGPGEGEKIYYSDGRSVLLKATAESTGARNLLLGTEALPKGTSIPVHSHDGYEEILFVHQGKAHLTLGDKKVEAEPGTTMYIPPGTWHGVESADPNQTTVLFIFPKPEIADFFRAVGHLEGEEPPKLTAEDWERIMKKHQMRARSN